MMRLATLKNGTPDGQLIVVSPDGGHYAEANLPTLQTAMEHWDAMSAPGDFPHTLETSKLTAPLPRAWQWLDGSVYASHGALMD